MWGAGSVKKLFLRVVGLHEMRVLSSGADIHVILRLFAQFGAPEYHIALGPADPEFVASDKWPWGKLPMGGGECRTKTTIVFTGESGKPAVLK